jgi:hypothetical protein
MLWQAVAPENGLDYPQDVNLCAENLMAKRPQQSNKVCPASTVPDPRNGKKNLTFFALS